MRNEESTACEQDVGVSDDIVDDGAIRCSHCFCHIPPMLFGLVEEYCSQSCAEAYVRWWDSANSVQSS